MAGVRNKQKRQSHYGADYTTDYEVSVDKGAATAVGGVVLTGVAIIGCLLVCWLNPGLA